MEEVNMAWQVLKEKCLKYTETDCLSACGKLTLLVRLDVNRLASEELSYVVLMYKIVNQTEITCISLIEVAAKMKHISCILLNKASKNSLRPLPEK